MAPTVRSFSADFEPLRLIARFPESYPGLLESSAPSGGGGARGEPRDRFDILPISCGESLRLDSHGRLEGLHAEGSNGFLHALDKWWNALRQPSADAAPPPPSAAVAPPLPSAASTPLPPSTAAGPPPPSAATPPPLPFTGGWLVYMGYELAAEIEPRVRLPPSTDAVTALALRAPAAWIRDRTGARAWLIAEPGFDALLDVFEERVASLAPAPAASTRLAGVPATARPAATPAPAPAAREGRTATATAVAAVAATGAVPAVVHDMAEPTSAAGRLTVSEEDPAQFLDCVARVLDYIAAGDVYQANLSRQWRVRSEQPLDPVAIYERLRRANPSPFAALLRHGHFALMSSSPERLLSIRNGIVSTRPIAGTRPRGTSPEDDAALVDALMNNDKERAEHVMLIDLERNDLGRVCEGGSVRVDEFMRVETYAHVHHIVSGVSGRLRAEVSPVEVIRALFPGGTITGCPKVRCMEIIAELEATGRGAYTGSVGYLNRDGSCDFNILIRTLTAHGPAALTFRAGAGIVADSKPSQELAETRAKAKGLLCALDALS